MIQQVLPGLYRSDLATVRFGDVLTDLRIEVLVSLVTTRQWERRGLDAWRPEPDPAVWLICDVADDVIEPFPADEWRSAVGAIVNAQADGQRCLVHCSAGRSRSGVAVAVARARILDQPVATSVRELKSAGLWRGAHPRLLAAVDDLIPHGRARRA